MRMKSQSIDGEPTIRGFRIIILGVPDTIVSVNVSVVCRSSAYTECGLREWSFIISLIIIMNHFPSTPGSRSSSPPQSSCFNSNKSPLQSLLTCVCQDQADSTCKQQYVIKLKFNGFTCFYPITHLQGVNLRFLFAFFICSFLFFDGNDDQRQDLAQKFLHIHTVNE